MIIGLGHQREVGKDLAGAILQTEIKVKCSHLEVRKVAFADPLYQLCKDIYGWMGFRSKEYYDTNKEMKEKPLEPIGKSPRQILIDMGTPAIRHVVWDETWLQYTMHLEADIIIITDVRFPNEAQAIKDKGGRLIKIERPGLTTVEDPNDPDNQLIGWSKWDAVLKNDGTIQDFSKICRKLADEVVRGL